MLKIFSLKREVLNDEQLYEALASGDSSAFDQVYKSYKPKALKMLTGMGCRQSDVDDLFQDAVLALWQNIQDGRFEQRESTRISSYLLQMCRNRFIDRTRRVAFRKTDSAEDFVGEMSLNLPQDFEDLEILEETELKYARLDEAFAQLGERCQEMLTRFYFKNHSLNVLAVERGITVLSVKNEKYRCMQRLRRACTPPKSEHHV